MKFKEIINGLSGKMTISARSVSLRLKVIIIFSFIVILVITLIGVILPSSLHKQNLANITKNTIIQMKHIDFAISNLITEVKNDILQLSYNSDVRTPDNRNFTNFLDADESTYKYSIGAQEQNIINILNGYRMTHPYVNSVYMGRENGAFIRSHKRERPTQYDPRTRPWYILAKEHPGQVAVTDPYPSVTTFDVNIGVVTALLDLKKSIYGVIGADITLENLTKYISGFDIGHDSKMILTDKNGMIIASREPFLLYTNIKNIVQNQFSNFQNEKEGILVIDKNYVIHYNSPEIGWKIVTFIPFSSVIHEIRWSIRRILLFVIAALITLSIITIILLNKTIIRPLSSLTDVSKKIAETGDMNLQIISNSGGEIGELASSFKAMMKKIRSSEQRLHDIIEFLPDPTFAIDNKGYVIKWNKAMEELTGIYAEQMIGKGNYEYTIPFFGSRRPVLINLLFDNDKDAESEYYHIHREGDILVAESDNAIIKGSRRYLLGKARLLYDNEGKSIGGIESIRDITDKKTTEMELEKYRLHLEELVKNRTQELEKAKESAESADRLKSVFLATMSHELRTPLNSIIGFTGILIQGLAGELNDEQRKQLGMVQNSSNHLLSLINDVLDLSKIEAGQLLIQSKPFDLIKAINKIISIILPLASKKGLSIKTEFEKEPCFFTGDERRFEQILINLLNNSVKFTEKGGITVICRTDSDNILIAVKDTGIGIRQEDKSMLFKPFQQLDSSTIKKYEGTGLGLSIVKKLVEMMNGEIHVESEIAKGSAFSVRFKSITGENK